MIAKRPPLKCGGARYRIVDFVLSNLINSGIRSIYLLVQYKSQSLIEHVRKAWTISQLLPNQFVTVVPPQRLDDNVFFHGTADAVYQNLDIIRAHAPEYVLILAGDHIYKMDYGPMIAEHVENGADMTVGCLEVDLDTARAFGVMTTSSDGRVIEFNEKPEAPQPIPGHPDKALASMGIYVFNTGFLFEQLIKDADSTSSSHDFGHDIIPSIIRKYRVFTYPFRDVQSGRQAYWRDVGTVDAFWATNLELIGVTPELNLYDQDWPIWTYQEQMPPAKFVFDDDKRRGMAVDSMVSGGCLISGAAVRHSLLFSNVKVNSYSLLEHAVVLPDVDIGRHCRISNAVIDRGCEIPARTVIGEDPQKDAERFHVTPDGVVLVIPEMLGQELHHVR